MSKNWGGGGRKLFGHLQLPSKLCTNSEELHMGTRTICTICILRNRMHRPTCIQKNMAEGQTEIVNIIYAEETMNTGDKNIPNVG